MVDEFAEAFDKAEDEQAQKGKRGVVWEKEGLRG